MQVRSEGFAHHHCSVLRVPGVSVSGSEDGHVCGAARGSGGANGLSAGLADAERLHPRNPVPSRPGGQLVAAYFRFGEGCLGRSAGGCSEHDLVGPQRGDCRRRLVSQTGGQAREHHEQQGDQGDNGCHQGKASFGKAEIANSEKHGFPFVAVWRAGSTLPPRAALHIGRPVGQPETAGGTADQPKG
ncbi:hypothetical protein D9M72_445980 [compost metagenome]